MKKCVLAVLCACLLGAAAAAQSKEIHIISANDIHAKIENFPQLAAIVDSMRAVYPNLLVLSAGDNRTGEPLNDLYEIPAYPMVALMNQVGFDATTLGNHEFDNGLEELARRISTSACPVLMCNYGVKGTPLEPYVKPYTIVKRAGMKIGIVGATSYLESNVMYDYIKNMEHLDTVAEVNKWADYLKNQEKCDMVIFLSHLGFNGGDYDRPSDHVMAAESSDIDIIVGGHSHTFIDEPSYVVNKKGKEVIIVTAGAQGVEIGELKVY